MFPIACAIQLLLGVSALTESEPPRVAAVGVISPGQRSPNAARAGDAAPDTLFTLLLRDRQITDVRIIAIRNHELTVRESDNGELSKFDLDGCVGLIQQRSEQEPDDDDRQPRGEAGVLVLTDGQQFPGAPFEAASSSPDRFHWQHPWFGALSLQLEQIAWARISGEGGPPAPGDADIVILTHGDRLEGFVTALGDPLVIELNGETAQIDLARVSAVRLVNPPKPPSADLHRVWLDNGTVIDIDAARLTDEGHLVISTPLALERRERHIHLGMVTGILFDVSAFTPLASIEPHDVEGPVTRYVVPPPDVLQDRAPLGLNPILFRGPLTARYNLPALAGRFTATLRLAPEAGVRANCEVIVRDDDRESFRVRLDAAHRRATVSIDLAGSELTIEVAEGEYGPIQDHVIFEQAMILSDDR